MPIVVDISVDETSVISDGSPPDPPPRINYVSHNNQEPPSDSPKAQLNISENEDLKDEDENPEPCSLTQCLCCILIPLAIVILILYFTVFSSNSSTSQIVQQNNMEPCSIGYTWFPDTSYCYKAVFNPSSFEDARSTCLSDGAHMTSIHSEPESIFIAGLYHKSYLKRRETGITTKYLLWIGITRGSSGQWQWIDGSPMDYEAWYYGMGSFNESLRYAYISHTGTKWYTTADRKSSFVCKKASKDMNRPRQEVSRSEKCKLGYYQFKSTSSCYMVTTNHTTFQDAHRRCKSDRGDLVSVHSDLENILLNGLIMKRLEDTKQLDNEESFWIGLKTQNKEYIWTDGSPDDFYDWWRDRTPDYTPGEDLVLCTYWKGWQPSADDSLNGYICKIKV